VGVFFPVLQLSPSVETELSHFSQHGYFQNALAALRLINPNIQVTDEFPRWHHEINNLFIPA
jgi:hypothetical protein